MKRALAAVLLLTLGLTEQASAQQFLPWTPGAGNSGGGCTNNCTFTGTTNTAGINDTSTLGLVTTGRLQWNGSASAGNGTNGAMLDQEPSFNLTQTVNQTRERYVFDTITNAQVGNTIDEGWFFGRQLTVSGSGSYNSEVNGFHVYLNDDSSVLLSIRRLTTRILRPPRSITAHTPTCKIILPYRLSLRVDRFPRSTTF